MAKSRSNRPGSVRHQLVVVALDEILPVEFGVPCLGRCGRQVKAQRVRIVLAQKLGHVDRRAAAFAELSATEIEVFMVAMHKRPSL